MGPGIVLLKHLPLSFNNTMDVLTQNDINVLPLPSKSPDLNPIKHLWDELDRRVRQRQAQSLDQLSQALNGK
jgi:transposase